MHFFVEGMSSFQKVFLPTADQLVTDTFPILIVLFFAVRSGTWLANGHGSNWHLLGYWPLMVKQWLSVHHGWCTYCHYILTKLFFVYKRTFFLNLTFFFTRPLYSNYWHYCFFSYLSIYLFIVFTAIYANDPYYFYFNIILLNDCMHWYCIC